MSDLMHRLGRPELYYPDLDEIRERILEIDATRNVSDLKRVIGSFGKRMCDDEDFKILLNDNRHHIKSCTWLYCFEIICGKTPLRPRVIGDLGSMVHAFRRAGGYCEAGPEAKVLALQMYIVVEATRQIMSGNLPTLGDVVTSVAELNHDIGGQGLRVYLPASIGIGSQAELRRACLPMLNNTFSIEYEGVSISKILSCYDLFEKRILSLESAQFNISQSPWLITLTMERLIASITNKFQEGEDIQIEAWCDKMSESVPLLYEIMLRIEAAEFDDVSTEAILNHVIPLLKGSVPAPSRDRVLEMIRRRWQESKEIVKAIDEES
jgi:hypothetical protein